MTETKDTHFMVILRADLPKEYFAQLYPVIKQMSIRETTATIIKCSEVDESNFQYLSLVAKLSKSEGFSHIKIPHQFILAIVGSKSEKKPLGFVWEEESHAP